MSARQITNVTITFAAAFAASLLLTGCAEGTRMVRLPWQNTPPPGFPAAPATVGEQAAPAPAAVATGPVDPINAPPPATTQAAMSDAMLVPAPSGTSAADGSQRVPLGTLGPAAAAGGAPTSLTKAPPRQAAKQANRAASPAPAPAAPTPPAPEPQQVAEVPPPAAVPAPAAPPAAKPTVSRDTFRSSIISTPAPVATAAPTASPVLRPLAAATPRPARTPVPQRTVERDVEEDNPPTVVISSASPQPVEEGREFVPASIVPGQLLQPNLIIGDVPMTGGQRNVVQRFETLHRLLDESLVTQDEYDRRRNANIGALLPYTKPPGGIALERSVPGSDAIIARLAALRRAFEMRAISATQHALERNMILNALLPEVPDERADQRPAPKDVLEGAAIVGHLESFRAKNLITSAEFDAERDAIEYALKNGLLPSQDLAKRPTPAKAAAKPAPAKAGAGTSAAATEADPMTAEITGPVLHLASFRTEDAARRAWTEATGRNKAAFASLKPIIRRVDLGTQGIFFRLMAGTFNSMGDAEATCIQLKQNNQFCRASADGS